MPAEELTKPASSDDKPDLEDAKTKQSGTAPTGTVDGDKQGPLPSGWTEVKDPKMGGSYFWNQVRRSREATSLLAGLHVVAHGESCFVDSGNSSFCSSASRGARQTCNCWEQLPIPARGPTARTIYATCDAMPGTKRNTAFTLWPAVLLLVVGTTFKPKRRRCNDQPLGVSVVDTSMIYRGMYVAGPVATDTRTPKEARGS